MTENLADNLTASAARHPSRPALRLDRAVITYAELKDAAQRVAGGLRERGVEPGDRVGVMLPNVPQFAAAYYGVLPPAAWWCR
jgi:long-chain acyl-CoA synthetase